MASHVKPLRQLRSSKTGGLNLQKPTKTETDFLRQTPFRPTDPAARRREFEDLLRQPFRPAKERRIPSIVPQIPLQVQKQLQERAWQIARRIAARPIPTALFRQLLQWLLDQLIDWFLEWLLKRGGNGGWQVVATVNNPNPLYNGAESYGYSAQYPMPENVRNSVRNGLLTGAGPVASLGAVPAGSGYAIMLKKGPSLSQYNIGYQRRTFTIPMIPYIDLQDAPRFETKDNPPQRVRKHLKPDWKAELNPDRIPDEGNEVEPDPPEADKPGESEKEQVEQFSYSTKTQTVRQRVITRKRTRTPDRTKEKKFQGVSEFVKAVFKVLSRIKEGTSEFDDLLDVFLDSMPKDIKKSVPKRDGRTTPDLKLKHIYDHFDKVDWDKFAVEFVKNFIEDKVVGRLISASDKAALRRGATNTIGTRGSWMHNSVGGAQFPRAS